MPVLDVMKKQNLIKTKDPVDNNDLVGRRHRRFVFFLALILVAGLFLAHASLIFEVAARVSSIAGWLNSQMGVSNAGKAIILGCFFVLFIAHFAEAAAWGFFLWRIRLARSFTDGVYFSAVSMTALGYGDVVLPPPWRLLGPVAAISGVLMFGCSTAFLFLVIQQVWLKRL